MILKLRAKIRTYGELVMFSHSLFSLPFAAMSMLWAAKGFPSALLMLKILIALLAARTGANAYNRYADRKIDAKNERTKHRHIPAGKVRASEALVLSLVCFAVFELAALSINMLCLLLSPVALLLFFVYSYTKRFTMFCHAVLGTACAGAPVGAWLAVTGRLDFTPFVIGFAVLMWVAGFDILYSMQDIEFDRTHSLYSVAAGFGEKGAGFISAFMHVLAVVTLLMLCPLVGAKTLYVVGVLMCAVLLAAEHLIAKPSKPGAMQWAAYHINQIVAVVFFVFAFADFVLRG